MALGKASRILDSGKPVLELFADAERAMAAIGTVKEADRQAGCLRGTTKYGLQRVKLVIEFAQTYTGTRMTVSGSSDDIAGGGAAAGVDRLLKVMESPSETSGDEDYLKRGMRKSTIAWPMVALVLFLLFAVVWNWLRLT